MEFWNTASSLRDELTMWLLKDFGNNRRKMPIQTAIKNISDEDKEILDEIANKYDVNDNSFYKKLYPEWFANDERNYFMSLMRDMMGNIVSANSIYETSDFEHDRRRDYQNKAIADCYKLYQELSYIVKFFPSDLNTLTNILEKIEKELDLLKGWRKNDNKRKKQ